MFKHFDEQKIHRVCTFVLADGLADDGGVAASGLTLLDGLERSLSPDALLRILEEILVRCLCVN